MSQEFEMFSTSFARGSGAWVLASVLVCAGLSGCSDTNGEDDDSVGDTGPISDVRMDGSSGDGDSGGQTAGFPNATSGEVSVPTAALAFGAEGQVLVKPVTYDGKLALGQPKFLQASGAPELERSGPWLFAYTTESTTVYVLDPRNGFETVHTIDLAGTTVAGIQAITFSPEANTTYVSGAGSPKLLAVEHGGNGDRVSEIDLSSYDTDGNPNAHALVMHKGLVLVGLSRMDGEGREAEPARAGKLLAVNPASNSVVSEIDLPHSNVSAGFSRAGDYLVLGVTGKREREAGGGFTEAADDGGFYAIEGSDADSLALGEPVLMEKDVETHVREFVFAGLDRAVIIGGVLEPVARTVTGIGGNAPSVGELKIDGESRIWTSTLCASRDKAFVGLATNSKMRRGEVDAFLAVEGSSLELEASGEVETDNTVVDCAWFGAE